MADRLCTLPSGLSFSIGEETVTVIAML
jgi:hypothetical protein